MEGWADRLRAGTIDRSGLVSTLLQASLDERAAMATPHDGLSCRVMGTRRHITADDWARRKEELGGTAAPPDDGRHRSRFHIRGEPRRLVTAITSLYRGGEFIEQFMDNITSQTIFDDFAELVIVDAQSPDDEARTIERYLARHRNIQYLRMDYRIGIYDAWNVGVQHARGEYLTNANLDDLRRRDSFELQAATLDSLPFVDIVYQDFHYSFDPHGSPEQAAAFGYRSQLPVVTAYNMLSFNSPHNAPMWRKRLHDELGLFDTHFRSAGDYDFWLRCLAAGKTFYKLNDPHVVYYQNPKGLSTRPDSRGVIESREISAKYAPMLTSEHMLIERAEFDRRFGLPAALHAGRAPDDRYAVVQERLRHAGRTLRFAGAGALP
jgi:glycosyltransferase involved in cell wall biosynthesis